MALAERLSDSCKRIFVVGPHPDDAEFSCGRLLIRRKCMNATVVCLTDGSKGQEGAPIPDEEFAKIRIAESSEALSIMGLRHEDMHFLKIKDQELIKNPFIIDRLFLLLRKANPDFILIPPWEGAHPDHDTTHLFMLIAATNAGMQEKLVEYGSYNNYKGKFNIQEFIPADAAEEKLLPAKDEQENWIRAMKSFKSQKSLQEKFVPASSFEAFRNLPAYDYSKLPYSSVEAGIIRDLLGPVYPIARKIIPDKDKLYYETWKHDTDPRSIKDKLNGYFRDYGAR